MPPGSTLQDLLPSAWRSFQPVRSLPLNRGRKPLSASAALRVRDPRDIRVARVRSFIVFFIIIAVVADAAQAHPDRNWSCYGLAWHGPYSKILPAWARGDLNSP